MPVDAAELARRLREARNACGLTQEVVAGRLGISRPALVQLEQGNRSVTSLELDRLAYLYGRDIREFLADAFSAESALVALFRRHPDLEDPEATLEAIRGCLALGRELTNLETHLEIDRDLTALPTYPLRTPATRWDAILQGARIAAEERRRLGLGIGPIPLLPELLEVQGVRTAQVPLPNELSGLTLVEPQVGILVVVNRRHSPARCRFSFAHEYCHVLLDRDQNGSISRTRDHESLIEVRANAFAAAFLLPAEGVEEFLPGIAKGAGRGRAEVFDGESAFAVKAQPAEERQEIQIYDVVLLAHHFGVSRLAAIYQLKSLKLLRGAQLDHLRRLEETGQAKRVAALLRLEEVEERRDDLRHRFLALGFEALRRGKISRRKLYELGRLVGASQAELDDTLESSAIVEADQEPEILGGND